MAVSKFLKSWYNIQLALLDRIEVWCYNRSIKITDILHPRPPVDPKDIAGGGQIKIMVTKIAHWGCLGEVIEPELGPDGEYEVFDLPNGWISMKGHWTGDD